MLIEDGKGNQLLALIAMEEADLSTLEPLTHALVIARHRGQNVLVFDRWRQQWELAGGTIDAGETPRDCAARELHEETGLVCDARALRFVGATKTIHPPNRLFADIHVEYGALFTAAIAELVPFVANEEIADRRLWDGHEPIDGLAPIDRKLIELIS
jgi:8-oxo-dGTP diphosphatase